MPGQPRRDLPPVAVNGQAVMETLHDKYGQLIAQLMAENANVHVAFETVHARNLELEGQLSAMRDAAKVVSVVRPAVEPAVSVAAPAAS